MVCLTALVQFCSLDSLHVFCNNFLWINLHCYLVFNFELNIIKLYTCTALMFLNAIKSLPLVFILKLFSNFRFWT